ncbi:hypothetical protein CQW23_03113 [Capsicum baccatum]|uniref:Ubiquitin-like protease family profile domain-containing protein n=1 Tax=Capsicum baccatum TaxID=33114 RepID=A0A2G2XTF3_CAPBA|nr:hypothetical protein CQW23_03113 [Capsicum baccatum]
MVLDARRGQGLGSGRDRMVSEPLLCQPCRCGLEFKLSVGEFRQGGASLSPECFSIPVVLPWHLIDEVYIPINCGDEFHWVLAIIILKERHIRVYDSMSRMRHSGPSSEIQKLAKILPTYLDMSEFLDQKVRTDWSTIEAYRDKIGNPFDVQCVEGIAQQTIGNLNCSPFVAAYAEYLSDGLQVTNDRLDAGLLRKRYAALLWKYGERKAQKPYASNIKDPRRPKPKSVTLDEQQLVHID